MDAVTPEMLDDQWEARDRPVLVDVARKLTEMQRTLSTGDPDTMAAIVALTPTYLNARVQRTGDGKPYVATIQGLTDRGRREVGLWPNEEATADALIDLLETAADQAEDSDDAGALRKAARQLKTVPAGVIAAVGAAWIRQQTGLP
jgi:hypothetical protein